MRIFDYCLSALLLLSMGVPVAQAQQVPVQAQGQSTQPLPAGGSPLAGAPGSESSGDIQNTNTPSTGLTPDNRPLAGAQVLSMGLSRTGRTLWSPYLDVSATFDSNPIVNQLGWTTWSSLDVGMDVQRASRISDFALRYQGGGYVSNEAGLNHSIVQQLSIAETFNWGRHTISLMDQGAYLPEASFGFYSGATVPAMTSLGLQAGFDPGQSILTSRGQRISNTFVTQIDTHLTRLSSLTFVGSYGLLHYFQNDLINDTNAILQAGYNHQMTRKDTIAFFYRFGGYRFNNSGQFINDHSVQISYARRVTGRSSFQITAGPDLTFSRKPIIANLSSVNSTNQTRQLFWTATSTLDYLLRRSTLEILYSHGVTSGSGVLIGAITDNASITVGRQLSRSLDAQWTVGYSRNRGFLPTSSSTSTASVQIYNYGFAGMNVDRRLGRAVALSLGYQAQGQRTDMLSCVFTPCGTSFLRHEVRVGLRWLPRASAR